MDQKLIKGIPETITDYQICLRQFQEPLQLGSTDNEVDTPLHAIN